MQGYKTIIVALATFAAGLGGQFGIPILSDLAAVLTSNVDALLMGVGAVFAILRVLTHTPIGTKE